MAFVDELKIHISAGRGGDGVVRWRREKFIDKGGPSGGNGGAGGSVFIKGVRDISVLARYRTVKEFRAGRGEDGAARSRHGANGKDLTIDLPVGSIVSNLSTGEKFELGREGETFEILHGGRGGLGNEFFKSSRNIKPEESTKGEAGETAEFFVELELFADAGIIGLPNAGKSSLLNALTRSSAKIGNYAFTTLEPNLGAYHGRILADIPGLIEGASEGKGLGHKFLRHIKRTNILVHCISLEESDPERAYETVRKELSVFDKALEAKPEIVLLTKTDTVGPEKVSEVANIFEKAGKKVSSVSVYDDESLKKFGQTLTAVLDQGSENKR